MYSTSNFTPLLPTLLMIMSQTMALSDFCWATHPKKKAASIAANCRELLHPRNFLINFFHKLVVRNKTVRNFTPHVKPTYKFACNVLRKKTFSCKRALTLILLLEYQSNFMEYAVEGRQFPETTDFLMN